MENITEYQDGIGQGIARRISATSAVLNRRTLRFFQSITLMKIWIIVKYRILKQSVLTVNVF